MNDSSERGPSRPECFGLNAIVISIAIPTPASGSSGSATIALRVMGADPGPAVYPAEACCRGTCGDDAVRSRPHLRHRSDSHGRRMSPSPMGHRRAVSREQVQGVGSSITTRRTLGRACLPRAADADELGRPRAPPAPQSIEGPWFVQGTDWNGTSKADPRSSKAGPKMGRKTPQVRRSASPPRCELGRPFPQPRRSRPTSWRRSRCPKGFDFLARSAPARPGPARAASDRPAATPSRSR